MSHHRPLAALAALVLAGALAAGCSSSGSSAQSPTTTAVHLDPAAVPASASAGCGATPAVAAGEQQIDLSGTDGRYYLRHVPPAHDGTTPTPLVLDLHGYSEGAAVHEQLSAMGPYGDTAGFVTITPQGSGPVPRWDETLGSDDLTFLGHVLDDAEQTLCIDQNRVYVTGLSNGAFMTSAMACQFADRVAAAAPVAGIRDIDGCNPSRPVPVIAFHGTADGFVDYQGGLGQAALDLPAPDGSGRTLRDMGTIDGSTQGPSIPDITAAWASRNGCGTAPTEQKIASDVTLLSFPCPAGDEVELYRIEGGGHTWPGSEFAQKIESVVGHTTTSVSANELIWTFFQQHPLQPQSS